MHQFALSAFDSSRIKALTLDLDDTLWPIGPTIARAEQVLADWLAQQAPATAALYADRTLLRVMREQVEHERPDLAHDLGALRRESIRSLLLRAGDDSALAEQAFEVFFQERQRVELFADALPMLERLAARFPLVALSNGNADIHRVGIGTYFTAAISAHAYGVAKPDPRIFHAAATAAGVSPGEVLHVGDDAYLDGVGALNAGMQLAWVNRHGYSWDHAPLQPHITLPDLRTLCDLLL